MAKAKLKKETTAVVLTLSKREALTLARLIGHHVVGPEDSPRRDTAAIYRALRDAGICGLPLMTSKHRAECLYLLPE